MAGEEVIQLEVNLFCRAIYRILSKASEATAIVSEMQRFGQIFAMAAKYASSRPFIL
jgi:hypothetical protein